MKPNIFIYRNFKNEDYLTNSLGYLLNLFPKRLGDRFVSKLAINAGKHKDYLGKFKEAEFSGYDLQYDDSTSKPDLIIHTDKFKIFFEIKLNAPLSELQLERHLKDVTKAKGKLVLISNVNAKVSKRVCAQKAYIKPIDFPHFFWTDFESVFSIRFRKNSLVDKLLSDFQRSLRSNGIKSRQIKGANDNLYVDGSRSHILALDKLSDVLKNIGFKIWRVPQDHTLRVYPKKIKEKPLINPWFYSTGEFRLDEDLKQECLIIMVYVGIKDKKGISKLYKLEDLKKTFPFVRTYYEVVHFEHEYDYLYRYMIYVPLKFIRVSNLFDLDWKYLGNIWQEIYNILAK